MSEPKTTAVKYQCGMLGGDCPVGNRDSENFCQHCGYCNKKLVWKGKS